MAELEQMLPIRKLGKKQTSDNEHWRTVWQHIAEIVSQEQAQTLVERAASEIKERVRGLRVGWGWSGGKDSQALRVVMAQIGIERCVLGMTTDELEYPAFLRWVAANRPTGLDVVETGQTLAWLAEHPEMLFPQDGKTAAKWFKIVQHTAQRVFVERHNLDLVILGRRHQDGNFTGKDGTGIYTNRQGVTRYCPIRFWTHEEVLGVCYWYGQRLAPLYEWPNGFVVGTGCWPARQWTGSTFNGWREIWQIDSEIVLRAAAYLPSAREFMGVG